MKTTFDKRIDKLKSIGFTETRVGMTDGRYSFLWHQMDTDTVTDEQFETYVEEISQKKR